MIKHQLIIGDEVYVGVNGRGGHGAYMTVTKINKKSIHGTERPGSYVPGTRWTIRCPYEMALIGKDEQGRMTLKWGVLSYRGKIVDGFYIHDILKSEMERSS